MTTLEDLHYTQRGWVIGMWCETPTKLGILRKTRSTLKDGLVCSIYFPEEDRTANFVPIHLIKPRFDLPRAWTPAGAPAEGPPAGEPADEPPERDMFYGF